MQGILYLKSLIKSSKIGQITTHYHYVCKFSYLGLPLTTILGEEEQLILRINLALHIGLCGSVR